MDNSGNTDAGINTGPASYTFSYTFSYYCTDCPYRGRCTDNGQKCDTCANNPKRSYYEPILPYLPYVPYVPWTPYPWQPRPYPWYFGDPPPQFQPTITCDGSDNLKY